MSEQYALRARRVRECKERVEKFILKAKSLRVFGDDLDFESNHWETPGILFANLDQSSRKLIPANAMKEPFCSFSKAYVRYKQGNAPTAYAAEMYALRALERSLVNRFGTPTVTDIDTKIFVSAAELIESRWSRDVAYRAGQQLESLGNFLNSEKLVPDYIDWTNSLSRPPSPEVQVGPEADAIRAQKLPSLAVRKALAEIFASNPTRTRDVLTSSTIALLHCYPSHISEIIRLLEDCEVPEQKLDGTMGYGHRMHPAKGGDPGIKWIPDPMAPVAQEAIRRLRRLTEEARRIARWYENEKTRNLFYRHADCPRVPEDQKLTIEEAMRAIGTPSKTDLTRLLGTSANYAHTLASINEWVLRNLPPGFPWLDEERKIKYSEALYCLQARSTRLDSTPSPILLMKVSQTMITNDIAWREYDGNGAVTVTIFERFRKNDVNGERLRVTSKAFRHLLNTMAQRGGLSQEEIAMWSDRVHTTQNRVYDHVSEEEVHARVRELNPSLQLPPVLDSLEQRMAKNPPIKLEEFLARPGQAAHCSAFGYCLHDYAIAPCQRFRDCLNCSEHICVKGDPRHGRLRMMKQKNAELLNAAKIEDGDGAFGADRWVEHLTRQNMRLDQLISIDEDPTIPIGTFIHFDSALEHSPADQALAARGQRLAWREVVPVEHLAEPQS